MQDIVLATNLPGMTKIYQGKARDVYELNQDELLIVAADRISAREKILRAGIPGKGLVVTQMTLFWLKQLGDLIPNHLITSKLDEYPLEIRQHHEELKGRSMIVRKLRMIPVECVVRERIFGSGWNEYQKSGKTCGIQLPPGLKETQQLHEPIFTPTTKAPSGEHDLNSTYEQLTAKYGHKLSEQLKKFSLEIFRFATKHLGTKVILADTKFEFGYVGNKLVLGDEVLTPDSSRYWPPNGFRNGGLTYDRQLVVDYLKSIHWDGQDPGPTLPDEIVLEIAKRYREVCHLITGNDPNV